MSTLSDLVLSLSTEIRSRLGLVKPALTLDQLEQAQEQGAAVAALLRTEGWQVIEAELADMDQRFLEALAEPGTHEQHLEKRGALRGVREARDVANEVIGRGLKAEAELEKRRTGRRNDI